jgi:flagellar assembly protein FliH
MGRIIKADDASRAALAPLDTEEVRAAAALVIRANRAKKRIATTAKDRIVDLALSMARQIVLREIERDHTAIEAIYRRAIESSRGMARGIIRVHPEDRSHYPIDDLAKKNGFDCIEDAAVGRAGCVIVAEGQEVDATLDTALRCFEEVMKDDDSTT